MFRGIEAARNLNKFVSVENPQSVFGTGSCKCSFSSQNRAWGFVDGKIGILELVLRDI
jgi:hypothetical protein